MNPQAQQRRKGLLACLLLFGVLCWTAGTARAGDDPVTCRYLQAGGQEVRLQLTVGSPPPASLIVIQNLPPSTAIRDSSPPVKRYNAQKGEAKWLLQEVKAGPLVLTLHLDQPVDRGRLSGEIRYRHPATGAMVTRRIAP